MPRVRLKPHGRHIRDHFGRIRLFRGVNVSGKSKLPPFLPLETPSQLSPLQSFGFNVIRLLVIWEAVAPQRGAIDETYLEKLSAFVEEAERLGIFVLIDMHQDLFSREHGGDGAPAWAVKHDGKPASGKRWFLHYFRSRAVQKNLARFWANEDGVMKAYADTLRAVVKHFSRHDNVIGYDMFNEPMTRGRELATGVFERFILPEFHALCGKILHEHDPERMLFIEPTPLAAFGVPTVLRRPKVYTQVFAPHLYDVTSIGAGRYMKNTSTFPRALSVVRRWAEFNHVPLFIGEFGVLNGVKDSRTMMEDECRLLDRHFVSWAAWHYNPSTEDWNDEDASIVLPGGADREFTPALARPYPAALAGNPVRWESGNGKPWELEYEARWENQTHTEIRVPSRWGAAGFEVEVEGGEAEVSDDREWVRIGHDKQRRVRVVLHRSPVQ